MRAAPGLLIALASGLHPGFTTTAAALPRVQHAPGWLPAHVVLLVGVALLDASLLWWPISSGGAWGRLRQAGIWLNVALYSAFIGVDGFASWIVAGTSPGGGAVVAVVAQRLASSPLTVALAWLGSLGWILSAVAIVATHRLRGQPAAPAVLLLIGVVWLGVSHAPPIGTVGGVLAAAAGGWAASLDASAT